ncbi:hypothetical protein [Alkalihalophilus marmarensis]|uniref:hypothetical protein n=1 Tax=Alkalihalophilus marmarensis TaxID=521377 RepID=UPI002E1AF995|nr:hypothetical protein [Alkalihalophilus marmarensis]
MNYILTIIIAVFLSYNLVFLLALKEKNISKVNILFAFMFLYSIPFIVISRNIYMYRNLEKVLWNAQGSLNDFTDEEYEDFKRTFRSPYLVFKHVLRTFRKMNLLRSLIVIPRISEKIESEIKAMSSEDQESLRQEQRKQQRSMIRNGYKEKVNEKISDRMIFL